jgi:hypothetical protein
MALFKRKHLTLIKQGRKTQTRRIHKSEWKIGRCYTIRDRYFAKGEGKIFVTRKFKQRLCDVSEVDIRKEGYNNLADFQKAWEEIHGQGSWDPNQVVTVYEFVFCKKEIV